MTLLFIFGQSSVKEYISGEGFHYLERSYRLKLVDCLKRHLPLRLYQSRFELQREAQARGREEFIRWYCGRLHPLLDLQIAAADTREIYTFTGEWRCCHEP